MKQLADLIRAAQEAVPDVTEQRQLLTELERFISEFVRRAEFDLESESEESLKAFLDAVGDDSDRPLIERTRDQLENLIS